MERLPEELISRVFDFLHTASALSTPMLVNRKWYMHGARNLHFAVVLNLKPGLTITSSDVVVSIMKRLVSPTLSTAHFIHHLTLSGFATLDIQELLFAILGSTTALRSLNMHALHILQGGMLLPPNVLSSDTFLPNLSAINVTSAQFCVSLARTRPLQVVRIHEPLNDALLRRLSPPAGTFSAAVKCLELALSIDNGAAAVSCMAYLASALTNAPLYALALQFVMDRPGPVTWTEFEHAVEEMGPSLQSFQNLRSLSLVIRPDPIIPVDVGGLSGSGEQYREAVTKQLAERLVANNGLVWLKQIELRWHGWTILNGELVTLPRTQLSRLPQRWLYHDTEDER